MNTYILVILLLNGNGGASAHHIEGFTQQSCKVAAAELLKQQTWSSQAIRVSCIERSAQ